MANFKISNLLQKKVKKIACVCFSICMVLVFMPANAYGQEVNKAIDERANNTNNSLKTYIVDDIEPGQVFTSGTYVLQKDIEVIQKESGGNGIEIQGIVLFEMRDVSLKISAGDARNDIGGGSGICLSKGNKLIVKGKGKIDVKGGNSMEGYSGGAGAGIGTPGGKGVSKQDALHSGDLTVLGDIQLKASGGKADTGCLGFSGANIGTGGSGADAINPGGNLKADRGIFHYEDTVKVMNGNANASRNLGKEGLENLYVKMIKQSKCIIAIKDAPEGNIYPYTGQPIEPKFDLIHKQTKDVIPKESYKTIYLDNVNIGKATIVAQGIWHEREDIPLIIDDNDYEISGDIEAYFFIK